MNKKQERFRKYLNDHEARATEASAYATKQFIALTQAKPLERAAWQRLAEAVNGSTDTAVRKAFMAYHWERFRLLGAFTSALTAETSHASRLYPEVGVGRKIRRIAPVAGKASGKERREKATDRAGDLVRRAEQFRHMNVSEAAYYVHRQLQDESPDPEDVIASKTTIWRAIHHLWKTQKKPFHKRRS